MKILLILPPLSYSKPKSYESPPLGLGYLASIIKNAGYAVKVIDACIENLSWRKLKNKIKEYCPDIIGISVTTETRHSAQKIIKAIRKIFPCVKIIAGGPHPSLAPQDTLEKIPELDVVVRGEAEQTILELIPCLQNDQNLKNVQGISYRDLDKIQHNPARPLIEDLDILPFPARELFFLDKYPSEIDVPSRGKMRFTSILTSRGCPMSCIFCASAAFWGKRIRYRSIKNIIEEIEVTRSKYGIKGISIEDDTFFFLPERVEQFCKELIDNKIDISWFCFVKVDTLTKELLQLMKKAGCFHIIFGAESGNDYILKNVLKKNISTEQVMEVSRWCNELEISAGRLFITGCPEETYKVAKETVQFMDELSIYKGDNFLSVMRIYPGTEVERLAIQKGIIPKDFSWMDSRKAKTFTFPSTLGDAPIFLDKMTWAEISAIIFQWARNTNYPIHRKVWAAVKDIRSLSDIANLTVAGFNFLRNKYKFKGS